MKNTFLITTLLATTALATNAVADLNCYDCMKASNCPENSGCQSQNNGYGTVYYKVETVGTGETQTKHMTVYGPTEGYAVSVPERAFVTSDWTSSFPSDVTSLSFSGKINNIGGSAFDKATNLHDVDLTGVSAVTQSPFHETSLQHVVLPDSFFKADNTLRQAAYHITLGPMGIHQQAFAGSYSIPTVYCPQGKDCSGFFFSNSYHDMDDMTIVSYQQDEIGTGVYIVGNGEPYSYYLSASNIPNTPCNDLKSCQVASLQAQGDKCTTQTECSNLIDIVAGSTSCAEGEANTIANCSTYVAENQINLATWSASANGNGGSSTGGNGGTSEQNTPKRRIYTVQEATDRVKELGTDTVNFRIRYK